MYYGCFNSWADVSNEFRINDNGHDKIVLFAAYDCPGYEGYAMVVFIQDGKFYLNEGSHCSCYSLENQWDPDETPIEVLLHMAENGLGMLNEFCSEFLMALEVVTNLGIVDLDPEQAQVALKLAIG